MRTIEELQNLEPVYLADWKDEKRYGVYVDFFSLRYNDALKKDDIATMRPDENVLFAYYCYADYSGEAFVLFEKGGKLYEVNGSHCSCNGLEGQWEPEETTIEALAHRLNEGDLGGYSWEDTDRFKIPLAEFLGVELKKKVSDSNV